jgi:hypothetical protein
MLLFAGVETTTPGRLKKFFSILLITAQSIDCFAERIPLENKPLVGCGGVQQLRRDQE